MRPAERTTLRPRRTGRTARPDLPGKLLSLDVVTPADLRAAHPNAVAGDPYGGSAELDLNLLWRPSSAGGRHATPYRGCGTSAPRRTPAPGSAAGRDTSSPGICCVEGAARSGVDAASSPRWDHTAAM
ncbi:hypothetical protein [Streptomyces sp. NBC_00582]|uniref:hypothetical protein n=1 Tax=Streptomyces sp. NBC_00582 TaxID=2975783 RepID=UPI002E814C0F|nr:hypothetical protein [Streptomyces sp. NBC_00582]WUB59609.1 hypothetical protein OG852_03970 [Streptomyces sp. NBC_00582]